MKTILLDVCHSSAVAAGEQHPGGRPAGSGEVPRYLEAGFRDARQQGVGRRQGQTDHHCLQRRYLPFPELAEYATSKEGTIKLDATKTPKQMDATSTGGEVMLGIYDLEGNRYKVCFAPVGKPRPSEFVSTPGSGYILQFWERPKLP